MLSSIRDNFTSSFSIQMAFTSFLALWLRLGFTALYWMGKSGHPCLFADLRGKAFSLSSLSMTFDICILISVVYHIQKMKEKTIWSSQYMKQKALDKIQHPLTIKTLNKLDKKGTYFNKAGQIWQVLYLLKAQVPQL